MWYLPLSGGGQNTNKQNLYEDQYKVNVCDRILNHLISRCMYVFFTSKTHTESLVVVFLVGGEGVNWQQYSFLITSLKCFRRHKSLTKNITVWSWLYLDLQTNLDHSKIIHKHYSYTGRLWHTRLVVFDWVFNWVGNFGRLPAQMTKYHNKKSKGEHSLSLYAMKRL